MLGNRRWLLKFLVPLGAFLALCADASWRLRKERPSVELCLKDPDSYDGRRVWMGPRPVESVNPDGFVINHQGRRVRVQSAEHPSTGRIVSVRGIFRKPDLIEAEKVKPEPYWTVQRGGVYGVSLVVLGAWLWYFLKRFRIGFRGGLLHPRAAPLSEEAPRG